MSTSLMDLVSQGLDLLLAYLDQITSSPRQIVAHVAALVGVAFVTVAAFVRTMIPLRWMAVGSNIGLLIFGALHPSIPTMLVAGSLLPINIWRAVEMMRLTQRVNRAATAVAPVHRGVRFFRIGQFVGLAHEDQVSRRVGLGAAGFVGAGRDEPCIRRGRTGRTGERVRP